MKIAETQQQFLTPQDVEAEFRISRRVQQEMRINGDGPPYVRVRGNRRGRSTVLYRREAVMKWLAEREYTHTAQESEKGKRA